MTPASVQMLVGLAAVAVAAGIVAWILHSRAAAKMRAREKAVEVVRSRAQERARVTDEADRRRITREEREIALARLAARRAELAKRREELLSPGVADRRIEPVAESAIPALKPPSQQQDRAQPSEVHGPMPSHEGSPAAEVPDPAVAAPDVVANDASNAVEVAAGGALASEVVAVDPAALDETAPAERPLSLLEEPAASPKPLYATDNIAAVGGGLTFLAAPPDEPVAPDLYAPLETESQPAHEVPVPITPGPPVLETLDGHVAARADAGEVRRAAEPAGEVVSPGALGETPCSPDHCPAGAEQLPALAEELPAAGIGEEVAANVLSKNGEGHVVTGKRDSFGVDPASHGDSSRTLEASVGGPKDPVPAVQSTPTALDAEPDATSGLTEEPRVTGEGRADQGPAEVALPSDVSRLAPVTVEVQVPVEVPASVELEQGNESDTATETSTNFEPPIPAAKQPRQYRPLGRDPASVRPSSRRDAGGSRDRGCAVDIRVQFAKGGFCRVSLLPRRGDEMPPNMVVSGSGGPLELFEMQDDFYEEVVPPRLGDLLAQGVAWESVTNGGQRYSWALGGREVYVLSAQPHFSGYLNTQRLILNEKHVVLCLAARQDEVLAAIAETGSPMPAVLGSDSGAPENWIALRDVVPRLVVQASQNGDILDCLRPLPEAQLSLEGGIRLEGNSWLAGFPPQIRVRGDHASVTSLFIDGHGATADATGAFVANGWDAIGEHVVAAFVGRRTYSIEGEREDWQAWTAHSWSLGEEAGVDELQRPSICGALVQAPIATTAAGRAIVVPSSNAILIGAVPGEIEICRPHSDSLNKLCIGFPNFEPVWAIPVTALRCDKRTSRVICLRPGPNEIVQSSPGRAQHGPGPDRRHDHAQRAWSAAILAAAHKGLAVNPREQLVVNLWKAYRDRARALSRGRP